MYFDHEVKGQNLTDPTRPYDLWVDDEDTKWYFLKGRLHERKNLQCTKNVDFVRKRLNRENVRFVKFSTSVIESHGIKVRKFNFILS